MLNIAFHLKWRDRGITRLREEGDPREAKTQESFLNGLKQHDFELQGGKKRISDLDQRVIGLTANLIGSL